MRLNASLFRPRKRMLPLTGLVALLVGAPLMGLCLDRQPLAPYLHFPPQTRWVQHAAFSWPIFVAVAMADLLLFAAIVQGLRCRLSRSLRSAEVPGRTGFPWWGWGGLVLTGLVWVVAWNRFEWVGQLQRHTFTPLWLGYIVVVNAWTHSRVGHCLILHRPRYFMSLFPLSALCWWYFEYLNRFVQNWHYPLVWEVTAIEYIVYATLSFSTVLPAVISTAEWLTSWAPFSRSERAATPPAPGPPPWAGWALCLTAAVGLSGMAVWPDDLFPLVWVAPLLAILGIQAIQGESSLLDAMIAGEWRRLIVPALAALLCGAFWELWNSQSLAHWEYSIPFVQRFHLFEMPLLGYAGYLPFGLACLAVADWVLPRKFSDGVAYYRRQLPT